MFKYFKYEYLSQLKFNLYIFISVVIINVLLVAKVGNILGFDYNAAFSFDVFFGLCLAGVHGIFFYNCIKSFITDLYDGRAYLVFSFPVSVYKIVITKIAVATINSFTLFLCYVLVQYSNVKDFIILFNSPNMLEVILNTFLFTVWMFSIIYFSIIVVHTITKSRKFIPLFVILTIIIFWTVETIVSYIFHFIPVNHAEMFTQVFAVIQIILFMLFSGYILDKKLEL
ncbi:hypothetical protein [Caviibacter abscessus]|uniref:hypothetical protein n=1 Tax=Caviibacter abscessus TaxID=1766719 RepID=UPI000831C9B0|nr:hypothetical protein [Caviibacter abscessus]